MKSLGRRVNRIEESIFGKTELKPPAVVITRDGKDFERLRQEKLEELGGEMEDYWWTHVQLVSASSKGNLNRD